MRKASNMTMRSQQTFQKSNDTMPPDSDLETLKKQNFQQSYESEQGTQNNSEEMIQERGTVTREHEVKRSFEIENLTGHIKFLYGILNNVIFTLNQHAVVVNKELLPAKNRYLESKVMVKMFENILSGTESVNLLNLLTQNEDISIFHSSEPKKGSSGWSKQSGSSKGKVVSSEKKFPTKSEQNITSNANNVIGTTIGMSSGNQSKYKDSENKPSGFSSEKKKYVGSMFNSGHSKSKVNKNILRKIVLRVMRIIMSN
jgi:hypothetical protein